MKVTGTHQRPLLDYTDINIKVPHVIYEKLIHKRNPENSTTIRANIHPRPRAPAPTFHHPKLTCNAKLGLSKLYDSSTPSCMKSHALSVPLDDGSID